MSGHDDDAASTTAPDALDEACDRIHDAVVAWRHHLHEHPELSNREEQTAGYVAEHLRSLGLDDVITGVAGHGVVGVLHGGAQQADGGTRTMFLRADIDALPVQETADVPFASTVVDEDYPGGPFPVSHACGHDCHTAMLMGAAQVLAQARDRLSGTVVLCFQPAEEGPPVDEDGGASVMVDSEALAPFDPTMALALHVLPGPVGLVMYSPQVQCAASTLLKITVTGEGVHGSTPWAGRDPLPPAAEIIGGIGQVYRQVPAAQIFSATIGHVEDTGRFNVVGDHVTLWGTVRALDDAVLDDVCERIRQLADHTAHAYGCTAETELLQRVPAVHNEPEWVEAALPTLHRVFGEDGVVQRPPVLAYDDASEFVRRYGGLYLTVGAQDAQIQDDGTMVATEGGRGIVPNHNPAFYADDDAMRTGVRLLVHLTVDHLAGRVDPAPA